MRKSSRKQPIVKLETVRHLHVANMRTVVGGDAENKLGPDNVALAQPQP